MRSIQSTAITFGLYNIPVKVCTVVREPGTGMSNACPHCEGDVGHVNICKECKEQVEFAEMRKAYKVSKDEKYLFSKAQLDALKSAENSIEVLGAMPGEIDRRYVTGCYYIMPDKLAKPWEMLRSGLESSENSILVRFALRGKQRLGILSNGGDHILMQTITFASNVVQIDEKITAKLSDKESDMSKAFVDKLEQVNLESFVDEYQSNIDALMQNKNIVVVAPTPAKDETAFFSQ